MNRIIFAIIFFVAIINSYLVKIIYDSYVNQSFLTKAYYGIIDNYSNDQILSISSKFPNISVTTVPIEVLKTQVLLSNGFRKDTLLRMLNQGEKANPYLQYSNSLRAIYYANQNNFDSLKKYSKIAYYNMPNHNVHLNVYFDLLEFTKDTAELLKAYQHLDNPKIKFTERYLKSLTKIKSDFSSSDMDLIDSLKSKISGNQYLKMYSQIFSVGKKNISMGIYFSEQAQELFKNKNYLKAAELFEEAKNINPTENSYYENSANSYMQAGKDDKAIEILLNQLNKLAPTTGKSEYLLGIIYLGKGKNNNGCKYLQKSIDKGFKFPKVIFDKFCVSLQ